MSASMKIPFVDLHAQYLSIKSEIDQAIASVIAETAFIKGPYVEKFEKDFARYLKAPHVVGCANGTDAIEMALEAVGVKPGDEVIVPANSWISTSEAVTFIGGKVVFVDSHPTYYTLDVSKIEAKITKKTKAIIPVHLYGLPAQMKEIMELAKKYNLKVIEDTAQGHGGTENGKTVGTIGDAGTFSFFPGKNLGAYGDAGGISCNDKALADLMVQMGNHGRLGKFDHAFEARNSRLDGLQAAILSAKLPHLEEWTEKRRSNAKKYLERLKDLDLQLPVEREGCRHVYHLFVVQVSNRDAVRSYMEEQGIACGIHYPIALPLLQAYKYLGHKPEDFPVASRQYHRLLSIPMYPELTDSQIDYVSEHLRAALKKHT